MLQMSATAIEADFRATRYPPAGRICYTPRTSSLTLTARATGDGPSIWTVAGSISELLPAVGSAYSVRVCPTTPIDIEAVYPDARAGPGYRRVA